MYLSVLISITSQVVTYVVTRPGRELLFTVVSQDEKYKAKVWILFTRFFFFFFFSFLKGNCKYSIHQKN